MFEVTGILREIMRDRVKAPEDGCHRNSNADGLIKGTRSMRLNGKDLVCRGMTSIYFRNKIGTGIKVFYSMKHGKALRLRTVKKQFKRHKTLYKMGIACRPHKIVEVKLDFKYYGKRKELVRHVDCHAYGIKVDHVFYHEANWEAYAAGKPYDWTKHNHPDHSPRGYIKFCNKAEMALRSANIGICGNWPYDEDKPPKLGDAIFDVKKNRWFIVDTGQ